MLILNNNIYIVDGAKKDCIYDLNANLLYHINKEASWLLNHLDTINDNDKTYNKYKEYINNLIEASIIVTDKKDLVPKIVPMNNTIDFAWIEITKQCNLRCLHCYADSDCTCIDEMTFDDFCYVIDELTAYKIKTIQIIGGEPFVNKRLYDMLNYCYGKFQKIEIFTNGTLITDEWIHFLYKHKIQLALSVYSYIASEHDKVTQRIGAYEKTISTIQKAKNKGIPYRICNVLMNDISLGEKNTNAFTLNPNKDIVRMSGRGNIKLLNKNLIQKN